VVCQESDRAAANKRSGYMNTLLIMQSMYNFIMVGIAKVCHNSAVIYIRKNINDEVFTSGLLVGNLVRKNAIRKNADTKNLAFVAVNDAIADARNAANIHIRV
jgi:hypothetical protein